MILEDLLFWRRRNILPLRDGKIHKTFTIDVTQVNSELARELYENQSNDYSLGGAFIQPIINSTAGFMGIPNLRSDIEDNQEILDNFAAENTSKIATAIIEALLVGDAYIWLTREKEENPLYPETNGQRTILNLIPKEEIKEIILDPITREPIEYRLESEIKWKDKGFEKQSKVIQTINKDFRTIEYEGELPKGKERSSTHKLQWGVVPIIHLKNEPNPTRKYGQSEIEKVEPYIKAYHEISKAAIKGSKMHSTPRLKLKLKDLPTFIRNNLGRDPGQKEQTLNLEGNEIIILAKEGEDAEFIEARSATGDAIALLKLLFYCIVDISEIPEFIFGVHTPSSLASVREQMPIMINKIKRKRTQFAESFQTLGRLILHIESISTGKRISNYTTTLEWPEIDPRSDTEITESIRNIVGALTQAVNGEIMSEEAAVDYLSEYINTMSKYIDDTPGTMGEQERIAKTRRLRNRYRDARGFDMEMQELTQKRKELEQAKNES